MNAITGSTPTPTSASPSTPFLRKLWVTSPPLMVSAVAHLAMLAAFVVLAFVDQRVVNGQIAWIKPAKFAISGAVYTATMAWMMGYIDGHRRALRIASWMVGVLIAAEVVLIAIQAGRGVISHFNTATLFDQVIFSMMGAMILAVWLAGWTVPVLLVRQRFADPALASALRTGAIIAMVGAAFGGLMTGPNTAQLQAMQRGELPERVGAHAVGAKDGGAGLAIVGWSTEGGDLRIAHFAGLHAFQVVPLVGLWIRRRGARRGQNEKTQRRLVRIAAGGYLGLIGVLAVQALRAEPLIAPSLITAGLLATLAAVTGIAWVVASRPGQVGATSGAYSTASAA